MRWSPDEVSEPLASGTVVAGRFEVSSVVAAGGMGAVYRATDRRIGRAVALKLLHVPDGPAAERFVEEARAASRISSRHVAAIHDFGDDPEHGRYMVMELLNGRSLAAVLAARGSLSPRQAITIAADIAEALAAAHEGGVVHRDLKPGNVILLDEDGVKVIDFGIATLEGASSDHGDNIVGTPIYISPEAVEGKAAIGPSADLYALGVVLFEMLTGEVPFWDEDHTALCIKHVTEPAPRLSEVAPGVELPEGLESMVDALLEKAPDMRPRDAREVALTLRAMSDTTGVIRHDARTPWAQADTSFIPREAVPTSRRPLWIALGLVLCVALGALGFGLSGGADAPETPASVPLATGPLPAQDDPAPEPAPPAPPSGVEAPSEPSTVEVRVTAAPASARLRLDGEPVEAPLSLPADGQTHELEVSARGYRTERREFAADANQRFEIVLRRVRRAPALPAELREW